MPIFLLKKVGAERTRIWTVTLAPQNKLQNLFFSSNCQKGHENPVSHFTLIAGVWRQKGKNKKMTCHDFINVLMY